ncbi:uncharacterized protein LOC109143073 [Larimichthys crocea]|uniref:uncharacterized protein LOC109143073 n=1 Tax=Larimichthys crocea TaxID=215358 RepID=UPI000F5EE3EA|nr:uncharacterized protein LOC109143073 [Larimichthys crocea]
MSDLLNKLKANPDLKGAASVLQNAGLHTDSEIRSLTREELHELFPGAGKLKQRRTIFEIINKPKPVHALINELKAFIPHDVFGAAQTGNGVMADYLVILKDLKTQLNQVQGFIDAHIDLLEGRSNDQEHEKGSMLGASSSDTRGSMVNCNRQTADCLQRAQVPAEEMNRNYSRGSEGMTYNQGQCQESTSGAQGHVMTYNYQTGGPPQEPQRSRYSFSNSPERKYQRKVAYQVVVSGKTFDADKQLMNKVLTDPALNQVQFVENQLNHQITILFCPVSSRVGTDVEAALGHVKDDKPVILVVMHHEREAKSKSLRMPHDKQHQVVLYVNVFYHDTSKGLLTCEQNNAAASEIKQKLLQLSTPIDTSGNAQGAGVESGRSIFSKFW